MMTGMIPESIRFALNMTIYPKETDLYFRKLFEILFTEHAEKPNGSKNVDFATLMMDHQVD